MPSARAAVGFEMGPNKKERKKKTGLSTPYTGSIMNGMNGCITCMGTCQVSGNPNWRGITHCAYYVLRTFVHDFLIIRSDFELGM